MVTWSPGTGEVVGLRKRIIDAASKVFLEEGYRSLSMRRVAQEAGCSQMAMYRHFANKEALTQHICTQIYTRFATKMNREIEAVADPRERLRRFIAELIRFATSYPDHYSLIFRSECSVFKHQRDCSKAIAIY
jgi:AcrR family transcriptional regulator